MGGIGGLSSLTSMIGPALKIAIPIAEKMLPVLLQAASSGAGGMTA